MKKIILAVGTLIFSCSNAFAATNETSYSSAKPISIADDQKDVKLTNRKEVQKPEINRKTKYPQNIQKSVHQKK